MEGKWKVEGDGEGGMGLGWGGWKVEWDGGGRMGGKSTATMPKDNKHS